MTAAAPTRPVLRYHGGKWLLAPWIIAHLPPHKTYVEPYGGAASVLIRKARSKAEIYNDLCDDVVNLFRVLRGTRAGELVDRLRLTPFARAEFEAAYETGGDPVDRAVRLVSRSFMGFGSDGHNVAVRTGFRANSSGSHTNCAIDWMNLPDALALAVERLRGVVIERRPALQVVAAADGPDTLFYVDPPYVPATRSAKSRRGKIKYHAYTHEMTDGDHADLLEALCRLEGMVVLSGYPSALYDDALKGWTRRTRTALADGARERTEVLWISPAASRALARAEAARDAAPSLFAGVAG